uniref:RRM domain-containing protein n=1 Tax=Medicago truncatula TaxID=3880 RepID=B7FHT4_MEDTR|nr:unknown [Medicago truncatula]
MKAIFCGNFEYDCRESELERLFRRYGKVDRVDMKAGFAFIYMEDERDAEAVIRALDRIEFGRKGRRLRVEWTKQERGVRRPAERPKRSSANARPSKTLFVINFDTYQTRTRDLERHFEPYGKIVSVRIRKNFAFVQYESEDDACKALEATNNSKLMDRVISVEFAARDDDRRNGHSPDRGRDRQRDRSRDGRRSPSPYRRERGSPDYGRGPSPYKRERSSPDYGRGTAVVEAPIEGSEVVLLMGVETLVLTEGRGMVLRLFATPAAVLIIKSGGELTDLGPIVLKKERG